MFKELVDARADAERERDRERERHQAVDTKDSLLKVAAELITAREAEKRKSLEQRQLDEAQD